MNGSKPKRVVIAMSGGVDSSVAACILKKSGYDLIGVSMKLWPKDECGFHSPTSCCSLESISDARLVSEKLDIPFYVLDFHKQFEKAVINYFTDEYLNGRTPNPCILCNKKLKFGTLLSKAEELNADCVATGHYASVDYDPVTRKFLLKEGADKQKDQSYVLFSLSQRQLSKALLPLGGLTKKKVRYIAKRMGLPSYSKPESQEICFVRDSYRDYLKKRFNDRISPGPIVDTEGKVLGEHKGVSFYTIGQREGLGIAHKHALYVNRIDNKKNTITVGPKQKSFFKMMTVCGINWIVEPSGTMMRAKVKIRSQHKMADAILHIASGRADVEFDEAQESPTPGQAAVFYDKGIVLGGGWIEKGYEN